MERSGACGVKIDFEHFDQDDTYVVSKGDCLVVDCRHSDLMEAPTRAIRRGPIVTSSPVRLEGLRLCPAEQRSLVDVIAACLAEGGARGDDPGR
jgi:hypothetical protein